MKKEEFKQRIELYKTLEKKENIISGRIAFTRLFAFAVIILGSVWMAQDKYLLGAITTALGVVFFGSLLQFHDRIKARVQIAKNLQQINQTEIQLLDLQLEDQYDGSDYDDREHSFSSDLDIFGEHSLFQLINRCTTKEGEEHLAEMLKSVPSIQEAQSRQTIIKELEKDIDWRQRFQSANSVNYSKTGNAEKLISWASNPSFYESRKILYWLTALYPLAPLAIIISCIYGLNPMFAFFGIPILGGLFSAQRKVIMDIKEQTSKRLADLSKYYHLIMLIEEREFMNPQLKEIRQNLIENGKASQSIKRLKNILTWMEGTDNAFFYFLTHFTLLWDFQLLKILEGWKKNHAHKIEEWVSAVQRIDALNSISGYAYAQESFNYPQIVQGDYYFNVVEIGHPLIPASQRVSNTLDFEGNGKTLLITGSNMSGKSTFLRTVGINLVLTNIGAPVCAKSFECTIMHLFTSMRTEDSLEENTSSFYAELKRIKRLIELTASDKKVLYLLDEILKGTNSSDRHKGAESLIRQLKKHAQTGFISTHDLELTDLDKDEDLDVINYSFTSEFEHGKLLFDYKIKEGACKSFNATELMKSVGIVMSQ